MVIANFFIFLISKYKANVENTDLILNSKNYATVLASQF